MEANIYIPKPAHVETVKSPWWSQAQEGGVALPAEWRARTETAQIEAYGIHYLLGLPLVMSGGSGQN